MLVSEVIADAVNNRLEMLQAFKLQNYVLVLMDIVMQVINDEQALPF
jgi:CheY-like chemotaxis protein